MTAAATDGTASEFFFFSKGVRTMRWFFLKALWPSTPVLFLYPIYLIVVAVRNPFANAFGHGEFLLVSLLLLIETALESEHLRHHKMWLESARHLAMYLAFLFTLMFAFMKWDTIVTFPKEVPAAREFRLDLYARLSCFSVVIAIALGLVAYYTACAIEEKLAEQKALEHD